MRKSAADVLLEKFDEDDAAPEGHHYTELQKLFSKMNEDWNAEPSQDPQPGKGRPRGSVGPVLAASSSSPSSSAPSKPSKPPSKPMASPFDSGREEAVRGEEHPDVPGYAGHAQSRQYKAEEALSLIHI